MHVIKEKKKTKHLVAAFCLFMRTSPINFDLLGGNGNTSKQRRQQNFDKLASIAVVKDL
jgi:hypothetical protein